jgi:hypothetical protein
MADGNMRKLRGAREGGGAVGDVQRRLREMHAEGDIRKLAAASHFYFWCLT